MTSPLVSRTMHNEVEVLGFVTVNTFRSNMNLDEENFLHCIPQKLKNTKIKKHKNTIA